jgi:hypothetical protein
MVPNALHLEASAIDPTRRPEEASWCCPVSEEMIYPFQSSQSIGTRAPFRKADPSILQAIDELNNRRKGSLLRALVTRLGEELSGTTIAVWGLAFKPNTDDMREAPSLVTIEGLLARGARVVAHDPEVMAEARRRWGSAEGEESVESSHSGIVLPGESPYLGVGGTHRIAWGDGVSGEITKSEYQELVEFIASRFDDMNKRFDAIDERLRRVEILGEENRHQIRILAEAVSDTVSKATFEAFRSEVAAGFEGLRELLQASHLDLDQRVTRLEEGRTG